MLDVQRERIVNGLWVLGQITEFIGAGTAHSVRVWISLEEQVFKQIVCHGMSRHLATAPGRGISLSAQIAVEMRFGT